MQIIILTFIVYNDNMLIIKIRVEAMAVDTYLFLFICYQEVNDV